MGNVLKITFTGVPNLNDQIQLKFDANYPTPPISAFNRVNVFKTARVNPGEVTIGVDAVQTAENYKTAFLLDYGISLNAVAIANVVYIEAYNGSPLFDYNSDSVHISFELVDEIPFEPNIIHQIIFTPRQYAVPAMLQREYLITEDDYFVITEDNKKIRL